MMNGGPFSGKSRHQDNVSLSTSEAKFVAASQAGKEALYLRETLKDFGYQQQNASDIYENDLACVAMSENPVRRNFSCHIDIRRYLVRELVKAVFVNLIPLHTHKMVAGALTKSLPSPAFIGHRRVMMGQTPVCFEVFALLICLFCASTFFFHDFSRFLFFLDCPMCSVNARIVHGGERYIINRPPSHERVREWTA